MNQTNNEQAYPESFTSLYSSYDQQLEQYIAKSNSNITNNQKDVSANKRPSQSNLNNENLSYHLYDDYCQ